MSNYIDRGLMKWMPFDALNGFTSMIQDLKKNLLLTPEKILTQDQYDLLNYNLNEALHTKKEIVLVYYQHQKYVETTGSIIKVNPYTKTLLLSTKEMIPINRVILLEII